MTKKRVAETESGIQGEFTVQIYDKMQRRLRDKGWIETHKIIEAGINKGMALEIGPGPGYLGLEWLKKTTATQLKALEISSDMIDMANKNAKEYNLTDRVTYVQGDAQSLLFDDNSFNAVFSNGSLHEWSNPPNIFNEIYRVLKKDGIFFISDFRRDISFIMKWFMYWVARPKEIRPGLMTSLNAAYTKDEIAKLLENTLLKNSIIKTNPMGLEIIGKK